MKFSKAQVFAETGALLQVVCGFRPSVLECCMCMMRPHTSFKVCGAGGETGFRGLDPHGKPGCPSSRGSVQSNAMVH